MPDAPDKLFDPASQRKEKEARANSKPYRNHPTVTVYEYLRMKRPQQDIVQRECAAIEKAQREAGM